MPDDRSFLSALTRICPGRVETDPARIHAYAFDASHYSQRRPHPPLAAVLPTNTAEVQKIAGLCSHHHVPIVPRGAGTGQTAGAVPAVRSIVVDLSAMNRIRELNTPNLQVTVEAGVIPEKLNQALEPEGFFFPPDPGSLKMCTIGGMIGNNASGMRAVKYGTTRAYVLGLEVVLADGQVITTGGAASRVLKSVSGYDLTALFVGSEGTLGIITAARLRVSPLPHTRGLILASFSDLEAAGHGVQTIFQAGLIPSALELMDRTALSIVKSYRPDLDLPVEEAVLIIELDGLPGAAREATERVVDVLKPHASSLTHTLDAAQCEKLWQGRRAIGPASSRLDESLSRVSAGEDIGVPIDRVTEALVGARRILRDAGIPSPIYGHIGDGNLHIALLADHRDEESIQRAEDAAHRIHLLALELGGTTTAEHGVGQSRAQYMEQEHGPALVTMRLIKSALDPQNIMNPGKMGL